MSALTDYSELPDWAKEAVLLWAIYLSTCKMFGGESNQSAQARTQYEFELQKVKRFMRVKDQDRLNLVTDVVGSKSIPTHKNVPINISLPLG